MHSRIGSFLVLAGISLAAQEAGPELFRWKATTPLLEARAGACAVRLPDGRVLVAGGASDNGPMNSAEIYQLPDGFKPAGYMTAPRAGHTCSVLDDGRVLAFGGGEAAEIYDPAGDRWERVAMASPARRGHTATRVAGGDIVFAGGETADGPSALLERWNAALGSVEVVPVTLATARREHAATLLPDGRVLISGGSDGAAALASTEILDAAEGTVAAGPSLPRVRKGHAAVRLVDDRVLVAGGGDDVTEWAEAEILRPGAEGFETLATGMNTARRGHLAVSLEGNGGVLFAGGTRGGEHLGESEVFQPWSDSFVSAGALTLGRAGISGALLDGGVVLAVGGANAGGAVPACGVLTVPTLTFEKSLLSLKSGATADARVSGANWPAGAQVSLSLQQILNGVTTNANSRLPVRALNPPGFSLVPIVPGVSYTLAGSRFTLTATGGLGTTAQASFDVKQSTRVELASVTPSLAGQPLVVNGTLPDLSLFPLGRGFGTGSLRYTGFSGSAATVITFTPGTSPQPARFQLTFCCPTAPAQLTGTELKVGFNGNIYYDDAPQVSGSVRVYDNVPKVLQAPTGLAFGVPTALELRLTDPLQSLLFPRPTGSVTFKLNGTSIGTYNLSGGQATSASYTARLADFLNPMCIDSIYSGDSNYRSTTYTKCGPVGPSPTTLTVNGGTFDGGKPTLVPISMTWPAADAQTTSFPVDLFISTATPTTGPKLYYLKTVQLTKTSSTTATLTEPTMLPLETTMLAAKYAGSADLDADSSSLPFPANIKLRVVPTATTLAAPVVSGGVATLTATVGPDLVQVPLAGQLAALPYARSPGGTMEFYDGASIVGSVNVFSVDNVLSKTGTIQVVLPTGIRNLKAVFRPFAVERSYGPSESAVRQFNVQ